MSSRQRAPPDTGDWHLHAMCVGGLAVEPMAVNTISRTVSEVHREVRTASPARAGVNAKRVRMSACKTGLGDGGDGAPPLSVAAAKVSMSLSALPKSESPLVGSEAAAVKVGAMRPKSPVSAVLLACAHASEVAAPPAPGGVAIAFPCLQPILSWPMVVVASDPLIEPSVSVNRLDVVHAPVHVPNEARGLLST